MKLKCEVIQDLLPLYHDQVCSRETKELVEEHLLDCPTCREYLQSMDEELKLGDPAEAIKPLRDMSKRIKRMKTLAFSFGLLVAAVVIFILWAGFAKYSEFVRYLLHLTKRSLILVLPLMLFMGLITWIVRKQFQKKGKIFPWMKAVCWILLIGWAGAFLYVTVLQKSYCGRIWNFQPFLMLREAFNRFTPQLLLNIPMNIAVFVPFGILLPLLFKKQEKWKWALLTGALTALGTELLQLLTARGVCDIDDVILDTLGTMLGWSATMLVLSFKNGEKAKSLRYLTVPVGTLLTAAFLFGAYYLKPYGNFPEGYVEKADLSGITFQMDDSLNSNNYYSAGVYKVGRISREESEQFAMDYAARQGIQFSDVFYYDTMIMYRADEGQLDVYYQDGSWKYHFWRDHGKEFKNPLEEQEKLLDIVRKLGVTIPDSAEVIYENTPDNWLTVRIRVNMYHDGESLHHGEVICDIIKYEDTWELSSVENRVFTLETVGHEKIIGEQEAFELLQKGKSFHSENLDHESAVISVSRPELDWQTDT